MRWATFRTKSRRVNPKKVPQTDAIFEQIAAVNQAADASETVLRLSLDAKATVKVGPFARGGKSRIPTAAADHDFHPSATVTPVGILLPTLDELFVYGITSKVTSDCLADCIERWWERVRTRFVHITTLVITLDNGPENHSRRTQFMQRIIQFAERSGLTLRLTYYPPYHSKYNPIERCWGILENHWNGALLDTIDAVIQFAESMTWKGTHPLVELVTTSYHTGVKLSKAAMQALEAQITRLPGLERWFVDIRPRQAPVSSG
jgi:transposase